MGLPLLCYSKVQLSFDLPSGLFGALSDLACIGRDDFKEGRARFVFIPLSDLEE